MVRRRVKSKYLHLNGRIGMRLFGSSDPQIRLICFAAIGGNSNHFSPLAAHLPSAWQLCAVELPGHGCTKGALLQDFDQLITICLENLADWFSGEFYLLGHSLGGLIVYVLTQKLEQQVSIAGTFVSAATTPYRILEENNRESRTTVSNKDIDEYLKGLEGPHKDFVLSSYLVYYRPVLRSDYRLLRSFDWKQRNAVHTPLYIMYGTNDVYINAHEIREWVQFGQSVAFIEIHGGHEYLMAQSKKVMDELKHSIYTRAV